MESQSIPKAAKCIAYYLAKSEHVYQYVWHGWRGKAHDLEEFWLRGALGGCPSPPMENLYIWIIWTLMDESSWPKFHTKENMSYLLRLRI